MEISFCSQLPNIIDSDQALQKGNQHEKLLITRIIKPALDGNNVVYLEICLFPWSERFFKKKLSLLSASEKITHSVLGSQKALDPPALEGSVHNLIVKIPNVGRSPFRSADGGSVEDHSALCRPATSSAIEETDDQSELNGLGPDKADLVYAAIPHEDQTRNATDVEVSEASSESSSNKLKPGTSRNGSTCSTFRSMNSLIESCVKYSEANTPLSTGDDIGMNLLSSVAAGEITKSDLVSPLNSPQRNSFVEEAQTADDARSKPSSGNVEHDLDDKKKVVSMTCPVDGHQEIYAPPGFDRAIKPSSSCEKVSVKCSISSCTDPSTAAAYCPGEMNKKLDKMKGLTSSPANMEENQGHGERSRLVCEEKASTACGSLVDINLDAIFLSY